MVATAPEHPLRQLSFLSIFVLLALMISAIALQGIRQYHTFEERQYLLAESATTLISRQIDAQLAYLRSDVDLFAENFADQIAAVANNSSDDVAHERLTDLVQRNLRGAFRQVVLNNLGELTRADFEAAIGPSCDRDIRAFAGKGADSQIFHVHPNPAGYHFDIITRWDNGDANGLFLVQFHPGDLAYTLANQGEQTGESYLIKGDINGLIEITAKGTRNAIRRDFHLSDDEKARVAHAIPIPNTAWQVVHVFRENLLADRRHEIIIEAILLSAIVIVAFSLLAGQIQRERQRSRRAERTLNSILSNLPGVVFRSELNTSGRLEYPYISSGVTELLGYEEGELRRDPTVLFRATHGDDIDRFHDQLQQAVIDLSRLQIEYRILGKNGEFKWVREISHPHRRLNGDVVWDGIMLDITDRKAVEEQLRIHSSALSAAREGIIIMNPEFVIEWVNPAYAEMTGFDAEFLESHAPELLDNENIICDLDAATRACVQAGSNWVGEVRLCRKDATPITAELSLTPVRDAEGNIQRFISIVRDLTERKAMETQLIQAEKMVSVGQLAAGIAHEINTPTQFVSDNLHFLSDAGSDLIKAIGKLDALLDSAQAGDVTMAQLYDRGKAIIDDADFVFLRDELPDAISQSKDGLQRISKIVSAMKEFSHPGGGSLDQIDVNHTIESTVTVARNEWKYVADLNMDLQSDLPSIQADSQVLGQTILNMIVNAAHAIADKLEPTSGQKGLIEIRTRVAGNDIEIRISDSGKGMPPEVVGRIFEPFFTTKEVGRGSGQGLAIAYSGIVEKHGGSIDVESTPGEGTTFIIRLPLTRQKANTT